MAAAMLCRRSLVQRAVPLALGISLGFGHQTYQTRARPYKLDAVSSTSQRTWSPVTQQPTLDEEESLLASDMLRQVSGGSVTGFLSGLLVSVFSRTLVLLMGVAIITFSVAAKYGIDLIHQFRLREKAQTSRILAALRNNTAFKLSFGVTFALSAFAHF